MKQNIPEGFQFLARRCEVEQARCTQGTLSLRDEQQQRQKLKGEGYIYILGAGALGCFFAGLLYQAKIPVVLLLKNSSRLQKYQQMGGIHFNYLGKETLLPVPAMLTHKCKNPTIILSAVKAFQLAEAIDVLNNQITEQTLFIPLNNGFGWEAGLKSNFIYSMHYCAAYATRPFVVHGQSLSPIYLGYPALKNPSSAVLNFIHNVKKCGLDFVWDENITLKRWEKLAVNCVINPLTAILNCRNGQLNNNDLFLEVIPALLNEIIKVAEVCGLTLSYTALSAMLNDTLIKTEHNYSSMLQDIQLNQRTEIDYLNGYIVRQAQAHGAAVPSHVLLTSLIKVMEKNYEKNHFTNIDGNEKHR